MFTKYDLSILQNDKSPPNADYLKDCLIIDDDTEKKVNFHHHFTMKEICSRHGKLNNQFSTLFNEEMSKTSKALPLMTLVDTSTLRNVEFLNIIRHVCCRGLTLMLVS